MNTTTTLEELASRPQKSLHLTYADPSPPGLVLIYTGRFQPWHSGHHDIPKALLSGRYSEVIEEATSRQILETIPITHFYIAVAHTPIDAKNPLSVGQR